MSSITFPTVIPHLAFFAVPFGRSSGRRIPHFRPLLADSSSAAPLSASIDEAKPEICTADELHFAAVPGTEWKLALWRYKPSPEATKRNHPLMLLSGIGMNAIGFDLSAEASFARYMCTQGFDTWIVEVRGSGLSTRKDESGLEDSRQISVVSGQIRDLSLRLVNLIEGQQSGSLQLFNSSDRLLATIQGFQKQLDQIINYNWDFDHYLEEDIPAAMEYIRLQTKSKDGKMVAVGHSMGGILLYAMLSKYAYQGKSSALEAVVTLASSVDYSSSNSSLKLLLPLVLPTQVLNVPVPLGVLLAAAYPFSSRPPYVLPWLNDQISAQGMMHPDLFRKLVFSGFCTIPAKLLLQLRTSLQEGGLRNRTGTFSYKDHLRKCNVPILALAGDLDLICPPEAVYDTVKFLPNELVYYKLLGKPGGPHYGHYDLVAGRLAIKEVYPCIVEFLIRHDRLPSSLQIDSTN